jgi:hypothetical protein
MRFMVAGILAIGMVTLAQAQPGFGFGFGGVTNLVTNKAVQEDLKVSEEQTKKISEWAKEFKGKSDEIRKEKMKDVSKDNFQEKNAEATAAINTEAYKELADVLKKEQINRLKQIHRQQMGLNAFTNTEVVDGLKLNDTQKTAVKTAISDFDKERREIFADAGIKKGMFDAEKFAEAQKKIQKAQKDTTDKLVGSLDDTQKKTWKEMIGEAFDLTKLTPAFPKKDTKKD